MPPVPLYRQTAGFTCGAAALVMALHHLRGTPVTRSYEFELWRDGTLVGTRGMDQWGLAIPALKRGVPATIIAEGDYTFPKAGEHARRIFTEEDLEIAQFIQRENRAAAEAHGVSWVRRRPTVSDIEATLAVGKVPVILVDLLLLGDWEAPHWVVGVETDGDTLVVHDPDPDGPGVHRLTRERLEAVMNVTRYHAQPTLAVFGP